MNMAGWATLAEQHVDVNIFEDCISKASVKGRCPTKRASRREHAHRGLPLQTVSYVCGRVLKIILIFYN